MYSKKHSVIVCVVLSVWLMTIASATSDNDTDVSSDFPLMEAEAALPICGSPENFRQGTFTLYDYSVVLFMLVISLGIGIFYGFFKKSLNSSADFLHGSGMTLFPVSLSLTTSFITAIELLGNPQEMFFNGTQYALIVISMLLVIPVAIKIFYPIYFKLGLTSCYEYLGIRFGNNIRVFGAILYIIQMCFYTAVSVYAPAIALSKATGLNTRLAVFLIYLVCIFYSSQGGMKAVVIADTFQACVLAFSLVLVVILGYFYTGGFSEVFNTAIDRDRIELLNFDPNPTTRHTVFSVVIGGFFYWTSLLCTNQATVQKCMSLRSNKKANLALIFSTLGLVAVFLINFYTGLMVFKHYAECDPQRVGNIIEKDELLPFYIMDVFGHIHFVNGIFVAGVFAASLGTVASALNSLSAVTNEDILATGLNIKINPEKGAIYIKWMSLGYGVLSFALVFLVEQLGGILQATLTLNGLIGGVTLGLFSLGVFFRCANTRGALFGGILALLLVIYVGVMAQLNNVVPIPLATSVTECQCYLNETLIADVPPIDLSNISAIFRISYIWYSFLGTALTVLFGIIISLISDKISKTKVMNLSAGSNLTIDHKVVFVGATDDRTTESIFMTDKNTARPEKYQLNGIDNHAINVEEM